MSECRDSLIDHTQSACLCDSGLPGYVAAVLVASDGCQDLVLVDRELVGDGRTTYNHTTPAAPHERLGPLPHEVRERIWGDILRCGRARCDGQPCRQRVKEPGQSCAVHCDGTSCGKCRSCYLATKQDAS